MEQSHGVLVISEQQRRVGLEANSTTRARIKFDGELSWLLVGFKPFICDIALRRRKNNSLGTIGHIVREIEVVGAGHAVHGVFVALVSIKVNFPRVVKTVITVECEAWCALEIESRDVIG